MFSSKTQNWETPQWLFDELHREFNFCIDTCASLENSKCFFYWDEEIDALKQNWGAELKTVKTICGDLVETHLTSYKGDKILFCNPPYATNKDWIKKASKEAKNGVTTVMLLPARTDTIAFHQYIYKQPNVEIRFLKGRLKFGNSINSAPFPSMIVIFRPHA